MLTQSSSPSRGLGQVVLNDHQQRLLETAQRDDAARAELLSRLSPTMTKVRQCSTLAYSKLVKNLSAYGNVLSPQHQAALMHIVGGYSLLAARERTGRYAIPLDTGCGKTQSVVAWCAAVEELGLPYSVAIAASKIEALCDLKRGLILNGVPAEKIGLWHAYQHSRRRLTRPASVEHRVTLPSHRRMVTRRNGSFLV